MRRRIAGTTLVGPLIWCGVSFASIGVAASLLAWHSEPATWKSALRFAAVTTSFCPLMSLLGAKRPQDKAWHFIVLSLWIVLALPAAENLVLRPGQALDVHGARSWFLIALIGLGLVNGLPTRFWISFLQLALGQAFMLADFMPFLSDSFTNPPVVVGLSLCLLAFGCAAASRRGQRRSPLDELWLDFRDSFGLLWGLRVQERINTAAALNDWPIVLCWSGFRTRAGGQISGEDLPPEVTVALRQNLENLLRRFVSPDWISLRIGESLE